MITKIVAKKYVCMLSEINGGILQSKFAKQAYKLKGIEL